MSNRINFARCVARVLAALVVACSPFALAATTTLSVALDTDNNAGTGCSIATVNGTLTGFEQVLDTVVTTGISTGQVGAISRRVCTAGVFGPARPVSAGGWPVGLGTGDAASDVIETFVPLADLGNATSVRLVAFTSGDVLVGGATVQVQDPAAELPRIPIPALSLAGLVGLVLLLSLSAIVLQRYARHGGGGLFLLSLLCVGLSGVGLSYAITRDGLIADWAANVPLATDAKGDASAGLDLVSLYAVKDVPNLSIRIDAQLARDGPANLAPIVVAGAAQTVTLPASAALNGVVTDDGLPNPPGALTLGWTKDSGAGTVTFANALSAATSASFSAPGVYVLRLTASDSALSGSNTVQVTVLAAGGGANTAPIVNAGTAQSIVLPATAALSATVTDDGLPNPPAALSLNWSMDSGPAGVNFGTPGAAATTAAFAAPGVYVLRMTANDSQLQGSGTVQITVTDGVPELAPIADRTIQLGTRFQQLLVGRDGNINDTLTYALTTAPAGAALVPSPLIDWTPTAAQLGINMFTARVTDSAGNTATTTFRVTVVKGANQPPQLATQLSVIVPVGTAFARTLTAIDPDVGDTLTFALVSGPAGMTLTGATLNWPTVGKPPGDYAVTVKVTDAGGSSDSKTFTVTLLQSASPAAPVARDDAYTVRLGQTLTVPAAGVLANDLNPGGGTLAATKLTDPDKGTLSAFNANGAFTYQAPPALAGPAFTPVLRNHKDLAASAIGAAVMIDLDGDGKPELVHYGFNHTILAVHADTGETLWRFDGSFFTGCTPYGGPEFNLAAADIDDDGKPEVVMPVFCASDGDTVRMMALNGQNGTVKWISPVVSAVPIVGDGVGLTAKAVPTIARLRAGESPSVLFTVQGLNTHRIAVVGFDYFYEPACRLIVDTVPDGTYQPNPAFPPHYKHCRGVIVLNGADGTIRQRMIAERTLVSELGDGANETGDLPAPVVVDLDGDGTPEIVAGGVTFNRDGSARWKGAANRVLDVAAGNFDDTPDIEVVRYERTADSGDSLAVYKADGAVLWRLPVVDSTVVSKLTVADVDGDGKADIVYSVYGLVCAINHAGVYRWCYDTVIGGTTRVDSRTRYAIFDFDGDGVAEVVVQTTQAILFLDGASGKLKASFPITQASTGSSLPPPPTEGVTYHPATPLVGDVDADGKADLVFYWSGNDFSAPGRLTVLKGQNNDWRPARRVQNQFAYHVANVNDDGTIPATVPLPNNFALPRTNVFGTQAQLLAPVDPRARAQTAFTYKASNGALDSQPATVAIDIAPANRPPQFVSTPPTRYFRNAPFTYTALATDPDVGDTVTYSIVYFLYNGGNCSIGAATGVLSCTDIQTAETMILLAATDSQGDRTLQTLVMKGVTSTTTVPNVVGQSQASATTTLASAGLAVGAVTQVVNPAPVNQVLAQAPSAGTTILSGEAVALSVSSGPAPTLVPNVVGEILALATTQLTNLGFTVAVTPQFSSTVPVNVVMAQAPGAGTLLAPIPANPVALTVSAGPPLAGTVAQIVVEPGPTSRLAGESQQYQATAIFTDGTSADVTLSSIWSTTAPAVASISATGNARALANGSTTLKATLGAGSGQTTLNVATRIAGDSVQPAAIITAPVAGSTITAPVTVTGTATDANFLRYELAVALAGDPVYTILAEGNAPVSNGLLGNLDPTVLLNDQYSLRLTVFDRGGNQTVATTTVQLGGNMKVGLFSLAFQDLNIPLAGIPINVTRTYDSRDKGNGDFGIGWRLGLQTLRLRANRAPGTGWVRNTAGISVTLSPTSEHKVSLTLSDGRVEEFDMVVSPTSNIGSLDATAVTGFAARPGTLGKLQVLGNTSLLILNGGLEDELVDDITLNTYDPQLFRYTTLDGTQIEIDRGEGVRKITDANGNSLSFGPNGIIHSAGRSVTFTRDLQNRITQITDPLGGVQSYAYDGNGDLVSHVNAVGNVSRYKYNRRHGLIEVQDPAGNQAVRNEYDAAGRLIAMTDANGNRITFTFNVGAQEELITDRRGNVNRVLYDARGNVVSNEKGVTINGALVNAVTTATYDAQNNETSRLDADGLRTTSTFGGVLPLTQVVDPAGLNLTTSLVYNSQSDPTALTDPAGRTYAFTYDGSRNVTGVSTPLQGPASAVFDSRGLPASGTDALGTKTVLTHDSAGNAVREDVLDAGSTLLRRTDTSYDANGNRTSETRYRTIGGVLTPLTTQYAYDAANRLVAVTDPLGGITRTEYDANGKVIAAIDPLGRRATYSYDLLSRLSRTTYPDNTFETSTYDAEGNEVATTDRAGRTTVHAYDELKRRVKTTLPDGSFTQTIFSPGGRVDATMDARGNRTDYAYDTAGRRTSTLLPAVVNGIGGAAVRPQVASLLNAFGTPVSVTDPNGRTTTFQYDANGRLTQTNLADGSAVRQTFDVLGRKTSVINEEGQATNIGYDGLGRVTVVSGLAGDATYGYDEVGNLITQSDALGRATRFRYDALGRLLERQYPGGEKESFAYDAAGNLVARTDGLGRTTAFVFDAMNRVTSKALPGGITIAYSYTPDGQRASVTDPRGTTTYGYDSLGQLASVSHPTGETVSYARDANGNLLSLASPAATVNYGYDALDRLVQVTAPEGLSQSFYDLAGNRLRQTAANGIVTDAIFDARNRPTQLTHKTGGGTLLQSYATTWSPSGRRTQITESDGSAESYAYDANGRLAAETRSGANPYTISHSYDAVRNRVQTVRGGTPTNFIYDNDDRLLSDGSATYGWDANGNLVSRTQGAVATQYGYDADDRLVLVVGGGLSGQYLYDADGNRVRASNATGTTRFLVDSENNTGLSQVLEEKDGGGTLQGRYSWGDGLLAMARGATSSFHLRDPFGSTRALADSAATLTDRYQYDAWGNTASATGSTANPYRFRGERLDAETGLYHLRARYYDAGQGRFISRDPADGKLESPVSLHRYLYANADPVNTIDPTGRESLVELSVVQALTNTFSAIDKITKGVAVCNAKEKLDLAGNFVMLTQLVGTAALSGSVGFAAAVAGDLALIGAAGEDVARGKAAWSAFGFNPFPTAVKSMQLRLEVPFALKLSTTFVGNGVLDLSSSFQQAMVAGGGNYEVFSIKKCGIVQVAKVSLKGRVKLNKGYEGRDIRVRKASSVGGSISAELDLLGVFKFEYPLFDETISLTKKGLKNSTKVLGF